MSDKMREQFEAWFDKQFWADCYQDQKKYFLSVWQAALSQKPEVSQPYAYEVSTKDEDELVYAIYYSKYKNQLPEGAKPLFTAPPDYEALKEQLIRSESDNTRLQSQYDEMRLKCSRLPVVAENEALRQRVAELASKCLTRE